MGILDLVNPKFVLITPECQNSCLILCFNDGDGGKQEAHLATQVLVANFPAKPQHLLLSAGQIRLGCNTCWLM